MHAGPGDLATNDHESTALRLKEISDAHRISQGPFFLVSLHATCYGKQVLSNILQAVSRSSAPNMDLFVLISLEMREFLFSNDFLLYFHNFLAYILSFFFHFEPIFGSFNPCWFSELILNYTMQDLLKVSAVKIQICLPIYCLKSPSVYKVLKSPW